MNMLVIVLASCLARLTFATRHVLFLEGTQAVLGEDDPRNVPEGTVIKWTKVLRNACKMKAADVCSSPNYCFHDLIYDGGKKDCPPAGPLSANLVILLKRGESFVVLGSGLHNSNITNIMWTEYGGLLFDPVTRSDEGIYFRRISQPDLAMETTSYNVSVLSHVDEKAPAPHEVEIDTIKPSEAHAHVELQMLPFHELNDNSPTYVTPVLRVFPPTEHVKFNVTYSWYGFDVKEECEEVKLFEPCVYHPTDGKCQFPATNQRCLIGSALMAEFLGAASLLDCSRDTLEDCHENRVPNLRFDSRLSESRAGLVISPLIAIPKVLIIVVSDGDILGWSYTVLGKRNSPRVVVETHMPSKVPMNKVVIGSPGPMDETGNYKMYFVVAGVTATCVILTCALLVGKKKCPAHQMGTFSKTEPLYAPLPKSEFEAGGLTDDEEVIYDEVYEPLFRGYCKQEFREDVNTFFGAVVEGERALNFKSAIASMADRILANKSGRRNMDSY
ncbi:envelope glycoprotein E [Gallid alphaherpesvirus 1]|uniref:Envelope glycoprotein E n=1 Tax=Infectious laryngotracheitis virus TaxID=10386 RepID=L7SXS7_ILTV|nr:envelope glycoprotein E [Gallid alphaherpesvirus 1]ATD84391.1 envelope glycoprotein E [Gallid alphaherpesvirus 1]